MDGIVERLEIGYDKTNKSYFPLGAVAVRLGAGPGVDVVHQGRPERVWRGGPFPLYL